MLPPSSGRSKSGPEAESPVGQRKMVRDPGPAKPGRTSTCTRSRRPNLRKDGGKVSYVVQREESNSGRPEEAASELEVAGRAGARTRRPAPKSLASCRCRGRAALLPIEVGTGEQSRVGQRKMVRGDPGPPSPGGAASKRARTRSRGPRPGRTRTRTRLAFEASISSSIAAAARSRRDVRVVLFFA